MPLTTKRIAFVEHYLSCWNASEAARRAGYKQAHSQGPRLLENVDVQAFIKARLSELTMGADEVLTRLGEKARFDIGPFVYRRGMTDELVVEWEKLVELKLTHLVKSVYHTQHGTRIEFHDAERALELIAKHLGLLVDRVEVEATHTVSDDVLDTIGGALKRGYEESDNDTIE